MVKSTGIYLRVSTEEQAKEGYSIRAQEEKLRGYAAAKDWHIYSVYADEGISGKDIDGRPAVKRMIADVTSGKINNVLVYKIDRLTRSTKNLIELVELFNQHDCAFNSLNESIDTSTATGRMFLKIVGIFAEFERENLAERVRLGLERKAKEGFSVCGFIPSYGYDRPKGEKIQTANEQEAIIVRRVFDMYLHDDYSLHQIARTLNAENVPSKCGKKWLTKSVRGILTNPNLIGKVRYACRDAGRYFEADGKHAPILDEGIYYQAQEKLGKMRRITQTKRPSSGVYFCGVLYCPACGGKYSSKWGYRTNGGGTTAVNPSYRCTNSMSGACLARKSMSHAKLERAFEDYITRIADFSAAGEPPADAPAATPADHSGEIAAINIEIAQIERKTGDVMDLFMSSAMDFATYQEMVKHGNKRRGELETRLELLKRPTAAAHTAHTAHDIALNFRENWAGLDNVQRQQFVQKFIKKIVVRNDAPNGERRGTIVIDEVVFHEF